MVSGEVVVAAGWWVEGGAESSSAAVEVVGVGVGFSRKAWISMERQGELSCSLPLLVVEVEAEVGVSSPRRRARASSLRGAVTRLKRTKVVIEERETDGEVILWRRERRLAAAAAAAEEELLVPMHSGGDDDEAIVDPDKLSYEIFSILESKFLFGYDDPPKLWPPPPEAAAAADESATTAAAIKNQRGKVRVLCIDGGGGAGMRGILPGKALAHLEQALKSKSGDPDARISDYFDVAAGTGVGGVFAAMLFATADGSRPLFHADDTWRFLANRAWRFLRRSSSSILSCFSSAPSPTVALERAMKETFRVDLTLRNTIKPVLIPCYDLRTDAALVFSRADALESPSFDFRLWEVCRATWAEPGRFDPAAVHSVDGTTACVGVDGGLTMSNPTSAAITHVLHNKQEFPFVRGVEDLFVLSLGCGVAPGASDIHKFRRRSAGEWAQPAARIAADGAADFVDHAVARAFGQCRSSNYVRVQANGSTMEQCGPDVDCDPSPKNVKLLLGAADEMLKQKNMESVLFVGKRIGEQTNMEKLDWFAGELVLEHQRRSCRIAPTVAFKQPPPKQAIPKASSSSSKQ